jgi:magnesium transporter
LRCDNSHFMHKALHKETPPGIVPGFIQIPENALEPRISLFSYNTENLTEAVMQTEHVQEIKARMAADPGSVYWIEVKGLDNKPFIEEIGKVFCIHRLELEDVVSGYQRPKLEEYPDHLFLTSRMLIKGSSVYDVHNKQFSLFLGSNFVVSFQDDYTDLFEPVRERIRFSKGLLRSFGPDYLAYALVDAVLDHYFPLLEEMGEYLDRLELELLVHPKKYSLKNLLHVKRHLIALRRTIWSERDKINDLLRTKTDLVSENTRFYLRDTYDHCIQLLDHVESYKEITSSMMDIYLSTVSNRTNQIMKVLAIISTIFIPLTFIVGVYGMNFSPVDPETGKKLPLNMPELYSPNGYVGVMLFMFLIVVAQLYFFYRKGWLTTKK